MNFLGGLPYASLVESLHHLTDAMQFSHEGKRTEKDGRSKKGERRRKREDETGRKEEVPKNESRKNG